MKKSLVALAALAAVGAASAQSSVTLFGIVDATLQYQRAEGNGNLTRLHNSGNSSSRFGLRGVEDLGGGMSASFHLESSVLNDDGQGAPTSANNQTIGAFNPVTGANAPVRSGTQGLTFNRRSTVSFASGFGEIRLGRDLTPTFIGYSTFDPFGTVGSGSATNLFGNGAGAGAAAAPAAVRASNSLAYFLPNLGGFNGTVMYALGENASNAAGGTSDDGEYLGVRLGYTAGPLNFQGSVSTTEVATTATAGDYRVANLGVSYNLGFARLTAVAQRDELRRTAETRQNTYMLGVIAPLGAGEFKASYIRAVVLGAAADADQLALGYVHNLSKRTALYTTYSRVNNKGAGVGFSNGRATTTAGGDTTGLDLGLRHTF